MENIKNKRGSIGKQIIIQIILIVFIFVMFLLVTADKINSRGTRQEVLEKEVALLIDSAVPGMSFEIPKLNVNGMVEKVELRNGNVFVSVDGLAALEGYPYFSRYSVSVSGEPNKFVVRVDE